MFSYNNVVKVLMLLQKESHGNRNGCIWKVNEYLLVSFYILEGMGFQPASLFDDTCTAVLIYC